jgi:dihydrofolate reductase
LPGSDTIFFIGGNRVYADALRYADTLYITEVDDDAPGDTYFPEYRHLFTNEVAREEHLNNSPPFTFLTLKR